MKKDKSYYTSLDYSGFKWYGYFDDLHHFSRKDKTNRYEVISCTEEMLSNGDMCYMAHHGLTYNPY